MFYSQVRNSISSHRWHAAIAILWDPKCHYNIIKCTFNGQRRPVRRSKGVDIDFFEKGLFRAVYTAAWIREAIGTFSE
jgi:hypothetical protein